MAPQWHYIAGELPDNAYSVHVNAAKPPVQPWAYTGIRVGDATSGLDLPRDINERMIVIASGDEVEVSYHIESGDHFSTTLFGRTDVFHGPSDVIYLPRHTSATITGDARVIIGEAPARSTKHVQVIRKEDVPILIRGKASATRQIHNFGMPDAIDADRLICVEGIVPSGNWSGVPAHKHDTDIPGVESHLEEIYYFECARDRNAQTSSPGAPFGYFRGYASDQRDYAVDATIGHGDLVLVPHGYHGPVAAAPGYDLYFFNVMAGPGEKREWLMTDDPQQAWIRQEWEGQEADPRLPYMQAKGR